MQRTNQVEATAHLDQRTLEVVNDTEGRSETAGGRNTQLTRRCFFVTC